MNEKIIVGLIGIVTGFLGALLKAWLDSRLKIDDAAREKRWEVYKALWSLTGLIPQWPRNAQLTYLELEGFSGKCREWYYNQGGFYLSVPARKAYGRMQEEVSAVLKGKPPEHKVTDEGDTDDYIRVHLACSALRTQLTKDLHSRQRGALHYLGI
jgi:hypothetical protein